MIKTFLNSIERAKNQINDSIFMFTHRKKNTYFIRSTAKMEFSDAICFILKGIKRTLQIELDNWFEFLGSGKTMTKQAFSQLRQKIKPEAFIHLNDDFITWFYDDDNFKKFKGYRLLAIDGSVTEIPNTARTREYFGYHHNQNQRQNARAMFSVIYDIENDYILWNQILEPGRLQSGKLQKNSLQNWKTRVLKMIYFYLIVDIHQKKCSAF